MSALGYFNSKNTLLSLAFVTQCTCDMIHVT